MSLVHENEPFSEIPEVLQSDKDHSSCTSYELETFLQRLDIEHRRSALLNSRCNGGVESQVITECLAAQPEGKTFADAVRTVLQTRVDTAYISRVDARS